MRSGPTEAKVSLLSRRKAFRDFSMRMRSRSPSNGLSSWFQSRSPNRARSSTAGGAGRLDGELNRRVNRGRCRVGGVRLTSDDEGTRVLFAAGNAGTSLMARVASWAAPQAAAPSSIAAPTTAFVLFMAVSPRLAGAGATERRKHTPAPAGGRLVKGTEKVQAGKLSERVCCCTRGRQCHPAASEMVSLVGLLRE